MRVYIAWVMLTVVCGAEPRQSFALDYDFIVIFESRHVQNAAPTIMAP